MDFEHISLERRPPVAVLTLDRPERLNAMHRPMLDELEAACDAVEADGEVRALVVTGAGRAFSSGFDLKAQAERPPRGVAEWRGVLRKDFDTVMRFWHLAKPTVAAVRGPALAGGFELAMACDLTVAAEDAVFGEPELRFGAGIVAMILPWITHPKAAKEIILCGADDVPARRAFELGLVNRVVPVGEELDAALALARRMAALDPALVVRTKAAIHRGYRIAGLDEALETALDADLLIEGEGSEVKRRFLEIVREEGMRAALAWRDARLEGGGDR